MDNILGLYIYNSTRNAWLQDDEKSWGSFEGAVEFTAGHEQLAQDIGEREAGSDTFFVMGVYPLI